MCLADDGFILSLVKSLRSLHLAAEAVVLYEGEIADQMLVILLAYCGFSLHGSAEDRQLKLFSGFSYVAATSTSSCVRSLSGDILHPILYCCHRNYSYITIVLSVLKEGQFFGESAVLASTKQVRKR